MHARGASSNRACDTLHRSGSSGVRDRRPIANVPAAQTVDSVVRALHSAMRSQQSPCGCCVATCAAEATGATRVMPLRRLLGVGFDDRFDCSCWRCFRRDALFFLTQRCIAQALDCATGLLKRVQIGGQTLFGQARLAWLITEGHRLAAGIVHRESSCVVERQRNAPAALVVVGGTHVAAIRAGHDETPTDRRPRLVDRATHARSSMATHQPCSSRAITCQPCGVTLVRCCGIRSDGSTMTVSRQQTASQRSQRFLMEKAS